MSNAAPPPAPPSLLSLFLDFFRQGATAFGGPAMAAHLRQHCVEERRWLSGNTFKTGLAVCQILPGAIIVNLAAYVGYRVRGLAGLLLAFAGFVLPSCLLLLGFSAVYAQTRTLPAMNALYAGLQVLVVAIVVHAAVAMGRKSIDHPLSLLIAVAGFVALQLGMNPFLVVLGAGLVSLALYRFAPAQPVKEGPGGGGTSGSAGPGQAQTQGMAPVAAGNGLVRRDMSILAGLGLALMFLLFLFNRSLFNLSLMMGKIEFFAYGGGYTALALMVHEVVSHGMMDHATLMDGVALGQVTPGPILITSTFIGYMTQGLAGALAATFFIFYPGLVLLLASVPFIDRLRTHILFKRALRGLTAVFIGLLAFIALRFGLAADWSVARALLCLAALVALFREVKVVYVVLAAAAVAIFLP